MLTVIAMAIFLGGLILLGLVALVRAKREDIPEVVRALASWWRRA
jgi:hypothetical protein